MGPASQKDGISMLQNIAKNGLEKNEFQPKETLDDLDIVRSILLLF